MLLGLRSPHPQLLSAIALPFFWVAMVSVATAVETPAFVWSTPVGCYSDSSPAIAPDGTIYFGMFDGKFWALNPDGSRKWVFRAHLEIKSSPAIAADGTIYFGSRDRNFYALNADGKKKWLFKTTAWVDSSPAIARDGTIYFGGWDRNFYALNPDGTKKWSFRTGGVIDSSPAVGLDGRIYFGSHDQTFYALDPEGRLTWKFKTGGAILSSAAIHSDQSVCFTSLDGFCYLLNPDGSLRWKLRTGGITAASPVISSNGTVYVVVNKDLWTISPQGEKQYARDASDLVSTTPVLLADHTLCLISGWGDFMREQPEIRDLRWTVGPGQRTSASPAVSLNGSIYLPCMPQCSFSALPPAAPLASAGWPKFRGNSRNTGNVADLPNAGVGGQKGK